MACCCSSGLPVCWRPKLRYRALHPYGADAIGAHHCEQAVRAPGLPSAPIKARHVARRTTQKAPDCDDAGTDADPLHRRHVSVALQILPRKVRQCSPGLRCTSSRIAQNRSSETTDLYLPIISSWLRRTSSGSGRSAPNISIVREEVTELPDTGVVATGPFTSERLTRAMVDRLGASALAFYDAIAPVYRPTRSTWIDSTRCPATARATGMTTSTPDGAASYQAFIDALVDRRPDHGHEFDEVPYFEGCLPVEEMARRGRETLRFGPMKPVGLPTREPAASRTPWCSCDGKIGPARCGTSWDSRPGSGYRSSNGSSG